jgi:hypothetical protein
MEFDTYTLPLPPGAVSRLSPGSLVYVKGLCRTAQLISSDTDGSMVVALVRCDGGAADAETDVGDPATLTATSDADTDVGDPATLTATSAKPELRVARRKLVPLFGRTGRTALLLTAETDQFRSLCRSQLRSTDSVLEVGCSFGLATVEIAGAGVRSVLAMDLAHDAIETAAARCVRAHGATHGVEFVQVLTTATL